MAYAGNPLTTVTQSASDIANAASLPSDASLASSMILRGAVGVLIGAAVAPPGNEGLWGATGFVFGSVLGDAGIVTLALAAMWMKGSRS